MVRADSLLASLPTATEETVREFFDVARQKAFFLDEELPWLDSSSPEAYRAMDLEELLLREPDTRPDIVRLGVEIDAEYIGFCSLTHVTNPDGVFELGINLGDRRYWDQGVGREVIRLLLEKGFKELGARVIELTTNSRNPRAFRCFSAAGFVESRRIPDAIPQQDGHADAIEMTMTRAGWKDKLNR